MQIEHLEEIIYATCVVMSFLLGRKLPKTNEEPIDQILKRLKNDAQYRQEVKELVKEMTDELKL